MCKNELRGWFSELDVSHWVLEGRKLLARSAWLSVLTDGCLSELDLSTVWVAVNVNVCDTHCCGWEVYIAWLLFGSVLLVCRNVFGLNTLVVFECSKLVVNCGGVEDLFIQMSQRVRVSLQSQGQIVIALLVLFGVRETWRRHVGGRCRRFNRDRVIY